MAGSIRDISPRIVVTASSPEEPYAPWHTAVSTGSIGDVDLDPYWGPAVVIRVPAKPGAVLTGPEVLAQLQRFRRPRLAPDDLAALKYTTAIGSTPWEDGSGKFRCLIATNADQTVLDPTAVDALIHEGCTLVGIDSPALCAGARPALPHLVALALAGVPEGWYALVALPLRLDGVAGSPVRAALKPLSR